MGWECFSHLRVMGSERTAERMKITRMHELLGLTTGYSFQTQL